MREAGESAGEAAETVASVVFYWRPGCGFCRALDGELSAWNIELDRRNIWEDPESAAVVRSFARGNETVPTVVVGPVGMVNPSGAEVVEAMREHAPHLIPEGVSFESPKLSGLIRKVLG